MSAKESFIIRSHLDLLHGMESVSQGQRSLQIFGLKRALREAELRAMPAGRDRPMRVMGVRGPGIPPMGGPPISPRGHHMMPRYENPHVGSPDGDRKHGLQRDMHPRYDKRLRS